MAFWFRRWALNASLILIAGCANAPVIPGSTGPHAAGALSSSVRPQTKLGDLLYYSGAGQYGNETYMLSFPKGELIGSFAGDGALCPDSAGNVWLAGYPNKFVSKELAEFAHGGETPIRTLDVPSLPNDCAVDPVTGNIAVVSATGKVYIYGSTCVSAANVHHELRGWKLHLRQQRQPLHPRKSPKGIRRQSRGRRAAERRQEI